MSLSYGSSGDMPPVTLLWHTAPRCELIHPAAIIMPDDVAAEKALALRALGAQIETVRPASIVDKKQVRSGILDIATDSNRIFSLL